MPLFQLRSRWFSTIITKTARIGSMNHLKNIKQDDRAEKFSKCNIICAAYKQFFPSSLKTLKTLMDTQMRIMSTIQNGNTEAYVRK